tara:strand:- start:4119 stop:5744 length:1626 start_codon:yes stop_codon:yes gene_type:complete
MCGIFCLLGDYKLTQKNIIDKFDLGHPRGPEQSSLTKIAENIIFGFHRLAINGYNSPASEQPIRKKGCILICNGEIYNWKNIATMMGVECSTGSDCEIIIHLYKKYGVLQTLQMLDGVFSFVLYDTNNGNIFVARDPHGVRPLFVWKKDNNNLLFASEVKMGLSLVNANPEQFPPGSYIYTNTAYGEYTTTKYYTNNKFSNNSIKYIEDTTKLIQNSLKDAIRKRVDNTDREIACLLSGGLDSSLVCGLVVQEFKERYGEKGAKRLHTWSIGMEGSEDLSMARLVADYLGTTHHEIKLHEQEFIDAIPEVIRIIESNDTTTVRASVGNYLICKYIRENSDAKVVFNGDGSDEVAGGYLYFHYAPDSIEFDKECRRVLKDIHLFDVLRSDRTISCHGLEARTPFLDRGFVETYLSIPSYLRDHNSTKTCEKYLIRNAFEEMNILPKEVLWRRKEAFSDGVSKKTKSWFEIIQDFAGKKYKMDGKKAEQQYYDDIFHSYYGDKEYTKNIVPYKWMPRFVNASDSSARTLKIYAPDPLTVEYKV